MFSKLINKKMIFVMNIVITVIIIILGIYYVNVNKSNRLVGELTSELQEVEFLMIANQYTRAIQQLNNILLREKKNVLVFLWLGYCHAQLSQDDLAIKYYKNGLSLEPDNRVLHLKLGNIYLQKKDLNNAKKHLSILDRLCTFGCREYKELKVNIENYD